MDSPPTKMSQDNRKKLYLIIFAFVFFIVFGSSIILLSSNNSENKSLKSSSSSGGVNNSLKSSNGSKPSASGPSGKKPVHIEKKELDPTSDTEEESGPSGPVDRLYIPLNRDKKSRLYSILSDGKDLQTIVPESPSQINHIQVLQPENQLVLSLSEDSKNRSYRFDLSSSTRDTKPIIDSDTSQMEFSPDRTKIAYICNEKDHKIVKSSDLSVDSEMVSDHISGYYLPRYAPDGALINIHMNTVMRDIHPDYPYDPNSRDDQYLLFFALFNSVKLEDKPQEMFISPDGKKILLKTFDRTEGHELSIVDVETKAIQIIYHQNVTCYGWSSDGSVIYFSKPDEKNLQILYKMVLKDDGKHKVYKIKNEKGEIIKL